ncbi:hypothetical protein GCK72_021011 [Caenorhabditis remanei]|uniref:F-box domain-containing protein n=1 Tax=Caenorhabditis remanei TaxID=31234 RepID=E3MTJ4_CAERE|nr:hypothetical protein GCK72_021011 [Caenorhabditis remanei]EFP08723.1 hypothetical protein CRE_19828 [Caenorhabditis remanei]KAF1754448.1 hypothetical protein GCK72_021011 [Caenorhabditis remanei]
MDQLTSPKSTSALKFSNLPTDAFGEIMEKCDLKEQLTLRKVSKTLRSLVDKHKLAYKSIEINPRDSYIFCAYNGKKVVYASENLDEKEEKGFDKENRIIRNDDYVKIALNDLSIALKNPKLRLDELHLKVGCRMNQFRLEGLMKQLNHQIHVKTLRVRAELPEYFLKNLLSILPCLKPKKLVNIEVFEVICDNELPSEQASKRLRKIANLEQWKQAEQLYAKFSFDYFPFEFLMHFKRFTIFRLYFDKDFLKNLTDLFSTSTKFESCTVKAFGLDDCPEFLESFCRKLDTGVPDVLLKELLYHYKIPDGSNKMLEFKVDKVQRKMFIEKKNL